MTTIVWDVDDVLNDLTRQWLLVTGPAAHADVAYADLTANPPHECLGLPLAGYLASLDEFRATSYHALEPNADIQAWFRAHGHRFHHVALTAVPTAFAHTSAEWVFRHFGAWMQTFAFAPSPREGANAPLLATKADYLRWLGRGDMYIDDREENVRDAEACGLRGVLRPQPWNSARGQAMSRALETLAAS
jgi:hypothetical protein